MELRPVRQPEQDMDNDQWAEAEFGNAPLGNRLRSVRLVKSSSLLMDCIGGAITMNTAFDQAAVKGHYRLMASKPATKVTPDNIVAPHRARTHGGPPGPSGRCGWRLDRRVGQDA